MSNRRAQRQGTRISKDCSPASDPTGKVTTFPAPEARNQHELRARPYPVRVTDAEYLATCVKAFGPHKSIYGNTVYLTFRIIEGQYAGQTIPMFLRFSTFPTSNFFRCWCIANEGLPSRNARLSPRMFLGKTYTIRTVTVRPRQRITGKDGKIRSGDPLPDFLAYSKVDCLVRLEINPDKAGFVTQTPCKSSSESGLLTGGVSSTKSEARSTTERACLEVPRGAVLAECTDRAGRTDTPTGPTPVPSIAPTEEEKYAARVAVLREQARQLQEQNE